MSTDLRDPASKPPEPEEKPKPALSFTQVVGGALAAMTAAFLGSRLSVAGTIFGAALASVVAAVAGAVYTSSLRRTSQTVSTVWRTVVRPDGRGGTETVTEQVTEDGTVVAEAVDSPTAERPTVMATDAERSTGTTSPDAPATGPGGRRRIGWKPVVAAAVLMFAIAAVALTGLELATGRTLSGGTGTTVGQVAEGRTDPTPKPTTTRSSSPSPTASESASASAEPTAEPTPSASSSTSSEPTAEPTPTVGGEPTPSASAAPSATAAEPSASSGPGSGATP